MNASAVHHGGLGAPVGGDSTIDSRHSTQTQKTPRLPHHHLVNHTTTNTSTQPHSTPTMTFPMRVEGMIDLQTLGKIHEALCMSEDHDDAVLAAWVKEHYLPNSDGQNEGGCQIRSAEGFEKLYNAYKRVRVLTNRAQDKWPFFDRRWKSMNAVTVRSLAQGDINMSPSRGSTPIAGKPAASPQPTVSTAIATDVSSQVETAVQPSAHEHSATTYQTSAKRSMDVSKIDSTQKPDTTVAIPYSASQLTDGELVPRNVSARSTLTSFDTDRPLFAADAEPEYTNLDDLPSSSAHKRKRADHNNDGKFARGHSNLRKKRRGGRGGRPRKDRSLVERADPDEDSTDYTPSTFDDVLSHRDGGTEVTNTPTEKTTPKMEAIGTRITRRTTRLSDGSQTAGFYTQKARADSEATAVNEGDQITGAQTKDNGNVNIPDNDSVITDPTDTELLTFGLSLTTGSHSSTTRKVESATDHKEHNMEQDNQGSTPQKDGVVEYFVRVHTSGAPLEIPLDFSALGSDREKLESRLRAYAAWKKDAKADVPFETWSSIFMLGR